MRLTYDMIKAGKSSAGGWSYEQAKLLGEKWPLQRGWIGRAIGRQIEYVDLAKFIELRNKHLETPARKIARRGRMLVDRFTGPDHTGSHTTTCQREKCEHPACSCT